MGNIEKINEAYDKVTKMRGEENLLRKQLKEYRMEKRKAVIEHYNVEKAKVVAQEVARQTQKKVEYHINGLVTSGLEAVFPEPYTFKLKFVPRRNKTEVDLIFEKYKHPTSDILGSGGGGVADIASYLLSIAVFSIKPSRPIFIRDENFKFLHSPVFQEKASSMIQKVAKKFGIQMILISDQINLYKDADKIINVKIKKGISYVE